MAFTQPIECLISGLVIPSTGARLASGKARFYDPGTLNAATVYSDAAGSSAITQPLTLTAGGTGTVFTKSPVRMIVKDSTDVTTLFDIDGVNATRAESGYVVSTSFNGGSETRLQTILDAVDDSFGGRDWKYKHAATATERNLKTWMGEAHVSIADYGAVGDDATDCTTPIANAVTAAAPGGVPAARLFIPPGTYRTTAATVIPAGMVVFGAGKNVSVIKGTGATQHGLVLGARAIVSDITIEHATSSTGSAMSVGGVDCRIHNVNLTGAYVTGFNVTAFESHIRGTCSISGSTNATLGSCTVDTGVSLTGAVSAGTKYLARTVSSSYYFHSVSTADMANGGSTTPTIGGIGQVIAYQRIRGTSAGGGTVNATSVPADTIILVLELYNNSGGAYTFTMNAQYKVASNPAPANGSRTCLAFVYNSTESVWTEIGRATST